MAGGGLRGLEHGEDAGRGLPVELGDVACGLQVGGLGAGVTVVEAFKLKRKSASTVTGTSGQRRRPLARGAGAATPRQHCHRD
eukprot:3858680-Rhodomonas_salina.2